MDDRPWIIDHGFLTMDYILTVDYRPRIIDHGLLTVDSWPWILDYGVLATTD